jgi:hypothetical protein
MVWHGVRAHFSLVGNSTLSLLRSALSHGTALERLGALCSTTTTTLMTRCDSERESGRVVQWWAQTAWLVVLLMSAVHFATQGNDSNTEIKNVTC